VIARRSSPVQHATTLLTALTLAGLVPACGAPAGAALEPDVARAVARRVQASRPAQDVVVLGTLGGTRGAELPWGVRQSLATSGIEVAGAGAGHREGTTLLVFEHSARSGGTWSVDVRLEAADLPGSEALLTWRVRCADGRCEAVDSVAHPAGSAGRGS
jgi:hypothetical protein